MRKTVKALEICEVNKELLAQLEKNIDLLKEKIAVKEAMVKSCTTKDSAFTQLIQSYQAEINNLQSQLQLASTELKKQNKFYRRQKRKTVFVALAGPALTAAAFIYIKK